MAIYENRSCIPSEGAGGIIYPLFMTYDFVTGIKSTSKYGPAYIQFNGTNPYTDSLWTDSVGVHPGRGVGNFQYVYQQLEEAGEDQSLVDQVLRDHTLCLPYGVYYITGSVAVTFENPQSSLYTEHFSVNINFGGNISEDYGQPYSSIQVMRDYTLEPGEKKDVSIPFSGVCHAYDWKDRPIYLTHGISFYGGGSEGTWSRSYDSGAMLTIQKIGEDPYAMRRAPLPRIQPFKNPFEGQPLLKYKEA